MIEKPIYLPGGKCFCHHEMASWTLHKNPTVKWNPIFVDLFTLYLTLDKCPHKMVYTIMHYNWIKKLIFLFNECLNYSIISIFTNVISAESLCQSELKLLE